MSKDNFSEIDHMLDEVREMLTIARDAGELNELVLLQMLLQVTKELHTLNTVHDIVTKVLDSAIAFVDADRAFMLMLDENNEPRIKMGRNANGDYLSHEETALSSTVVKRILDEQKTIIIDNVATDQELSKRQSVQDLALQTILGAPLIIKKQLIGLMYLDGRHVAHHTFTNRATTSFIASLADQAAVAIHNAQKFETHL